MATPIDFKSNPNIGDIEVSDVGVMYEWDGFKWTTQTTARNSSLGGNPGPNPPNGAVEGDFWFNTDTGQLYIRVDMGTGILTWERTSLRDTPHLTTLP